MKNLKKIALAISLGWLGSPIAFASTDAGLQVGGTITPAACNLTLNGTTGEFDFGQILASQLPAGDLPWQAFTVDMDCASPTKLAIRLVDNREDSVTPLAGSTEHRYGLGLSPAGKKIGSYGLFLGNLTNDGAPLQRLLETAPGVWGAGGNQNFNNGQKFSWAVPGQFAPASLEKVSFTASLRARISRDQGMTFEEDIHLDGSSVLEMIYL